MSFAHQLKKELCEIRPFQTELQIAQLSGLLMFCKTFDSNKIIFTTEYIEIANYLLSALKHNLNFKAQIQKIQKISNIDAEIYSVSITDIDVVKKLAKITDKLDFNIDETEKISAFVRGAFLACGTITNPEKSYHIEFVSQKNETAEFLCKTISKLSINAKISTRKETFVVYLKESAHIEDLVTYMGGTKSTLELMNVKIYKNLRNKVNRQTNCETANLTKTVSASSKQINDIKKIEKYMGIESLNDDLQQLAKIRLENPDMSLSEIAQELEPPISRSGVNHRFKKIAEIAEKI